MILERVRALLDTLRAEHDALTRNDLELLSSLTAQKERQLAELDAGAPAADHAEWQALVSQCREQNEINGALIHARRRFVESFLELLRPSTAPAVYDASGTTRQTSEPNCLGRV